MSIDLLVADFIQLAGRYPNHSGIILAAQNSYSLSQLIELLDKAMAEASWESKMAIGLEMMGELLATCGWMKAEEFWTRARPELLCYWCPAQWGYS